ncbi:MAG: GTPase family protein [Planctomycetota bacterium]
MKRWQGIVLAVLILLPLAFYAVWTGYAVWKLGGVGYFAWIVPLCWTAAWWLGRRWLPKPAVADTPPPTHWTARDESAWRLVLARAERAGEIDPAQMLDPHFHLSAAQDLALEIARHYHPQAADPLGPLTVPEIMAAAELALRDTSQWVRDYVPGSHLMRVDHWRLVAQAPKWAKLASRAWWVGSVLLNPADIVRKLVMKASMDAATGDLQAGLLAGVHSVFIQRAGFYLIEVHSGRLRRGAEHYLAAQRRFGTSEPSASSTSSGATKTAPAESPEIGGRSGVLTPPMNKSTSPSPARSADAQPGDTLPGGAHSGGAHSGDALSGDAHSGGALTGGAHSDGDVHSDGGEYADGADSESVRLLVLGQAKAGKSSLINVLLGEAGARVDVVPCTRSIRRHRATLPGSTVDFSLLDSPGYGDDALPAEMLDEIQEAATGADLVLLVLNATQPARNRDLEMLDAVRLAFADRPERKLPPVLAVLTHIDGLRPVLEW